MLIDAPAYDPTRDNRNRNLLIAAGILLILAFVLGIGGFALGHGWFFSNLPAEHKVNHFFTALQDKDYAKAYDIYENGQPDSGYPLPRFTEDWTTYSPVKGPLVSHHVDVSKTDGSGKSSTIIVGVTVNGSQRVFVNVLHDGTLTCCSATHEIEY